MEFLFKNLKPVSTNNLYKGMGKRRCKSKEYLYLKTFVKYNILQHGSEVRDFMEGIELGRLPLNIELTFFIPKRKLFTKDALISKCSLDLDNMQKSIIDAIFDNLELDDAYICELLAKKRVSHDDEYHILFKMTKGKIGEL